jgi:hypothetical protein
MRYEPGRYTLCGMPNASAACGIKIYARTSRQDTCWRTQSIKQMLGAGRSCWKADTLHKYTSYASFLVLLSYYSRGHGWRVEQPQEE